MHAAIQKYDELLKSAEDEEDVMSYKMQLYACNLHLSDLIHNNFNDEKHHLEQGTVPYFIGGEVAVACPIKIAFFFSRRPISGWSSRGLPISNEHERPVLDFYHEFA
jgi:hypothetical protein